MNRLTAVRLLRHVGVTNLHQLCLFFSLLSVILAEALVVAVLRWSPLPVVVPENTYNRHGKPWQRPLFLRLTTEPTHHWTHHYSTKTYQHLMEKLTTHSVVKDAAVFSEYLHYFAHSLNDASEPHFGYEKDSLGIVTSCRLNWLCLVQLRTLVRATNGEVPIELWLEKRLKNSTKYSANDTRAEQQYRSAVRSLFGNRVQVRFFEDCTQRYKKVFGVARKVFKKTNFHRKTQAMVCSRFQHVIWVDSDVLLVRDPRTILADERVQRTGTMYWRDMSTILPRNKIWGILGVKSRPFGGESGVVYIDKAKAWRQLYVAAFMNQNQRAYSRYLYGDKDLYYLACLMLGEQCFLVPYVPLLVGAEGADRGVSFLQPTPDGKVLFVHLVGPGKAELLSELRAGRPAFGSVTLFDPNAAHIGSCSKPYLCVYHHGAFGRSKTVPARDVLGDAFIEQVALEYKRALDDLGYLEQLDVQIDTQSD